MASTPRSELDGRVARLQAEMPKGDLDAVLVLQNADLFYFAGTVQEAFLFIPAQGEAVLLVRKSYERAKQESALETIIPYRNPREIPDLLKAQGVPRLSRVGLEFDVLPVLNYQRLCKVFPLVSFADASQLIRKVRAIKSPYEIEKMRKAAHVCDLMAQRLKEVAKVGMAEVELAAELEYVARKAGHQGISRFRRFNQEVFFGHLLAGESGAVPSYLESASGGWGPNPAIGTGASWRRIQANEPIILDYLGTSDGYLADQARTFSIGVLPADLVKAYEATLAIYEEAKRYLRPGVRAEEVFEVAVDLAGRLGYGEFFMNYGEAQVSYVGHGVGLELDEYPFLAKGFTMTLETGMTVALEPKIVLPGLGMVGIEDTFLITEGDPEPMTFTDRRLCIL